MELKGGSEVTGGAEVNGLSVVIPSYGPPDDVLALIVNLHEQDLWAGRGDFGAATPPALQIIVVDDAYPDPFPEGEGYEVVRRPRNGGFGSAVNSGAAAARHEWLMILNSDLTPEPEVVGDWLRAASQLPRSITAPRMIEPAYEAIVGRRFQRPHHVCFEALEPLARFHEHDWMLRLIGLDTNTRDAGSPIETDWLVGAALLLRTADFRSVGGFDERYYMNAEEMDLQRRLRDVGVRAVHLPSVVVHHASGGSSPSEKRAQWAMDGRFLYSRRWGGKWALRSGLHAASVVNLGWQAQRRLRGQEARPVRGFRAMIGRINVAWRFQSTDGQGIER